MRRCLLLVVLCGAVHAQIAVRGALVHTMAGEPIRDGVVLIESGKISQVGPASSVVIPDGWEVLRAPVVTPGLIDAHTVVGLSGHLNHDHDQDQVDASGPMQPELRAVDAYNGRERLVDWVRSLGVTTLHTGHAPAALVSGQTMVVKTRSPDVDSAVLVPTAMVACTLGDGARPSGGKSPGTRGKTVSLLRESLVKAQEYAAKRASAEAGKEPARDLRLEVMARVLNRDVPLLVTAHRAEDLLTALRLADEFKIRVVLDGAAEAYLIADRIKTAGVPVIVHPPMMRTRGERENATMELAAKLDAAGIPIAFQSGYETYVPKTRVVLFEAAIAAAHGLGPEKALAALTLGPARILGIADRVGSLESGKDADLALFDGDPFEYTTHCTTVIIDGQVVSRVVR